MPTVVSNHRAQSDAASGALPSGDRTSHQEIRRSESPEQMLSSLEERERRDKSGIYSAFTHQDETIDREISDAKNLLRAYRSDGQLTKAEQDVIALRLRNIEQHEQKFEKSKQAAVQAVEVGTAVAAGVAITVATGGAGAGAGVALVASAVGSAAVSTAAHRLVQGETYHASDMARDMTVGTVAGLVGGAGVGKIVGGAVGRVAAAEIGRVAVTGAVDGAVAGAAAGAADRALRADTWQHGAVHAAAAIGEGALQGGTIGAVVGGAVAPLAHVGIQKAGTVLAAAATALETTRQGAAKIPAVSAVIESVESGIGTIQDAFHARIQELEELVQNAGGHEFALADGPRFSLHERVDPLNDYPPAFRRAPGEGAAAHAPESPLVTDSEVRTARPSAFERWHEIYGDKSSAKVKSLIDTIRDPQTREDVPPITAVRHEGNLYVVDGHHRLEAFRRLGEMVPYREIEFGNAPNMQNRTLEQFLQECWACGPNNLKKLGFLLGEGRRS